MNELEIMTRYEVPGMQVWCAPMAYHHIKKLLNLDGPVKLPSKEELASMNEKRETEFALIFAQLTEMLASQDIREYLHSHSISTDEINALSFKLKDIAARVFYGERK